MFKNFFDTKYRLVYRYCNYDGYRYCNHDGYKYVLQKKLKCWPFWIEFAHFSTVEQADIFLNKYKKVIYL